MNKKTIYFFIGTSAELIKVAPVMKELKFRKLPFKIITSGQNKVNFEDMKDFMGEELKPDISLQMKQHKASPFVFLIWVIQALLSSLFILKDEFKGLNKTNSYFIIHGDTVTSSLGAFIATVFKLKLVHIESGDMSGNLLEPFPEEISRNINIRLADILFSPNEWAMSNLKAAKGVKINTKNNTLIESFWWAIKTRRVSPKIPNLKKYYILILHRQEHVIFRKNWSREILDFVINNADDDLQCVLLNHPLTVGIIKSLGLDTNPKTKDKIIIIPRMPYPDFMKLMKGAEFMASDGCTNQLEAYLLGSPFLALRDRTEQVEGLNENVVICKSNKLIMRSFLKDYEKYKRSPVLLRKRPSKIIVDYLLKESRNVESNR